MRVPTEVTGLKNQLFLEILECVHVINAPEDSKIGVFNKGTLKGLTLRIPLGGRIPNS